MFQNFKISQKSHFLQISLLILSCFQPSSLIQTAHIERGLMKKYVVSGQQLFNAEWQKVLPSMSDNSVDLLLTDPPYNTTALDWDEAVDWPAFWAEAHRVCKPTAPMVFFASGKFVPVLLNSNLAYFRYELIWEKTISVGFLDANRRPLRAHEQILVFAQKFKGSTYNPQKIEGKFHTIGGKGAKTVHYDLSDKTTIEVSTNLYHPRSVLKYSNATGGKSLHPTAKPLPLVDFLVRSYSSPGDGVLDPFVGSGTTLAASLMAGRRGLGIERSEKYFDVAKFRLIEIANNI
jgi:DNA modification methylase